MIAADKKSFKNLHFPNACSLCIDTNSLTRLSYLEQRLDSIHHVLLGFLVLIMVGVSADLAKWDTSLGMKTLGVLILVGLYLFIVEFLYGLLERFLVSKGVILQVDVPICEKHSRRYKTIELVEGTAGVIWLVAAGFFALVHGGGGEILKSLESLLVAVLTCGILYILFIRRIVLRYVDPLLRFRRKWFRDIVEMGFRNTEYEDRLMNLNQLDTGFSSDSESSDTFVCSNCGATVSEDDKVCPSCGETLEEDESK